MVKRNKGQLRMEISKIKWILREINPTRVDIGSIDRPPAYRVEPLSYNKLREISFEFNPKNTNKYCK